MRLCAYAHEHFLLLILFKTATLSILYLIQLQLFYNGTNTHFSCPHNENTACFQIWSTYFWIHLLLWNNRFLHHYYPNKRKCCFAICTIYYKKILIPAHHTHYHTTTTIVHKSIHQSKTTKNYSQPTNFLRPKNNLQTMWGKYDKSITYWIKHSRTKSINVSGHYTILSRHCLVTLEASIRSNKNTSISNHKTLFWIYPVAISTWHWHMAFEPWTLQETQTSIDENKINQSHFTCLMYTWTHIITFYEFLMHTISER